MGTVRLVPSSSTFRAPIWTRARTPRCDLRSSTLATPSPIMRTRGAHHHRRVLLGLCPPNTRRTEGHECSEIEILQLYKIHDFEIWYHLGYKPLRLNT
jgi:hypothetical protein